jgi:hypothetical protein
LDQDTPDHLDFALPSVEWTISSNDPQWRSPPPPGVTMPSFVCAGPAALSTDCCAPTYDCQRYPLACDPIGKSCALTFDLDQVAAVDLVDQVAAVRGRVFARVEILSLTSSVSRSRELPIRSASLYVGPAELATRADPDSTFFAPLELVADSTLTPDLAAREAFSAYARDYERPFSLLLSAHVVVSSSVVPDGTVQVSLNGRARAYY